MIRFPNCKINLGLYVTGKRTDGYHNLQTAFYPVALHDVLEIVTQPDGAQPSLFVSGIAIEQSGDNSCLKAYGLLKKLVPQLPAVQIHLHKAIPIGGGLGGGSADAAFTLLLLNKKFGLNIAEETLLNYAAEIGSDCAFFIKNTPCLATGRGEMLARLSLDLSDYKIVLVNPGLHINTGWAFAQITPKAPQHDLKKTLQLPVAEWRHFLYNDFEPAVFNAHPAIADVKERLYQQGAVYASLSGSGATVYGLFKKSEKLALHFPLHFLVKEC